MSHNSNIISNKLTQWYSVNKRDLPWRDISDPYKIWISEIILQQTRVAQGMDYYLRFIDRFPTVDILAQASEDEILKYWQGLGYYSRARNLHKAAKMIVDKFQGDFPTQYEDVISLPGIGEYTAAAICSFAYHLPYAVVDGNVFRVLARLFAIDTPIDSGEGKKIFKNIANDLLDKANPGLHNQAIMEFGALQCVPVNPDCEVCPLQTNCLAFANGDISLYPSKQQKVKVRDRFFNYLFIHHQNKTYLQQRKGKDVWKNLYEFPLIESENQLLNEEELLNHPYFEELIAASKSEVKIRLSTSSVKHILSHQRIFARCFVVKMNEKTDFLHQFEELKIVDIDDYAISRLMEILIHNHLGDMSV